MAVRWNPKRIVYVIVGLLVLYLILSCSTNVYQIDKTIRNVKPEKVWEFVADFSKMKQLNPTILNFRITADHGNNDHWKYSVIYTEKLSHWPFWLNEARANFDVKRPSIHDPIKWYEIESRHETCFFNEFYCLNSKGSFKFTEKGNDTYYMEVVTFECPPFMKRFCRQEVEYQRRAILLNLIKHFSNLK